MAEPDDLKLIRKIVEQGGSKYTGGNIDRRKYERLFDLGWLKAATTNVSDVLYEVTESGKADAEICSRTRRTSATIASADAESLVSLFPFSSRKPPSTP